MGGKSKAKARAAKPAAKKASKAKPKAKAKAKAKAKPGKAAKPAKASKPKAKRGKTTAEQPTVKIVVDEPTQDVGADGGEGGDDAGSGEAKPGAFKRIASGVGSFFAKMTGRKATDAPEEDTEGAAGRTMEITTEEIIVAQPVPDDEATPTRGRKKPPPLPAK